MSILLEFAQEADVVVYQSEWARNYLYPFTKVSGEVIINGIDLGIFKETERPNKNIYLYSRFNRDETKNWEMARYVFSQIALKKSAELFIVGQFSDELREYNFDFYNNESIKYLGIAPSAEAMQTIYSMCDKFLYTYFNDACSNTLIEALSSGLEIVDPFSMLQTGGSSEIMSMFESFGREFFSLDRMGKEYMGLMNG